MPFKNKKEKRYLALEESLEDEWTKGSGGVVEVPIGNRPLFYLGVVITVAGLVLLGRILYLNSRDGDFYAARALMNANEERKTPAPRGLIYDRSGKALAGNVATFAALLDIKEFMRRPEAQEGVLKTIYDTLFLSAEDVSGLIKEFGQDNFSALAVLSGDLNREQLVRLKEFNSPAIVIRNDFERDYKDAPVFSSVLGYLGRTSADDLKNNPALGGEDFIGRAGVEAFYNGKLAGKSGEVVKVRNARGQILSEREKSRPQMGEPLRLTIDGGLQRYFYERLRSGLAALGRNVGVGIAMNPQNGEILALINMPSYDNNILSGSGNRDAKMAILNSKLKPLFDRAASGFYNPGSTIKPLVGVAALKEGVIDPKTKIFSPGYLDVPNPYDPENPTRFLDWRYQGDVDLVAAIAQSSNVYFYTVGGGADGIKGLGINRLNEWWQKFGLGKASGIDLPQEAAGFLPTIRWRENKTNKPWLLGDTYNVSIGQGDLLVTPIQLLNYISAIANGGKIYRPVLNLESEHPKILADLSYLLPQIKEVQKGMAEVVAAPLGNAHLLADLGFSVAAKTGTAQVRNNTQENALFAGYAPADKPQIAVLVLIENSLKGSLNAVPIAKDVLNWYYWNRISK